MSRQTEKSKILAYVLRHNPASIGITLDPNGWTDIDSLLAGLEERKHLTLSKPELREIVIRDRKGRYTIDGNRIRANQGHSLKGVIAVDLTPMLPPSLLYHGTNADAWVLIKASGGLHKMKRHHVHLSKDQETAQIVATRWKGKLPILLQVHAKKMCKDGFSFFLSDNHVWMTDQVPLSYIELVYVEFARG
jgi:putative RNA 2'-phosphotransferase